MRLLRETQNITARCFLVAQVRCGVRVLKAWYGCVINDSSSALGKESKQIPSAPSFWKKLDDKQVVNFTWQQKI